MGRVRGLGVVIITAMGAWLLWRLRGRVGTPVVSSWSEAERWYDAVGPTAAIVAGVRVAAMVVACWLTAAATLELLASFHPWSGIRALTDLIAPRSLQRLVHGLAGLSLTAGLALPAPSAGLLGAGREPAWMVVQADPSEGGGTATMHLVDAPTVEAPVADESTRVVVVPGDSFWSIAEHALRDANPSSPNEAEIARYWRRVIDENRATLVDPGTPDLIYAGQVFTLPSR